MYEGTSTVVFGATGFIGRWVTQALSDRGSRVVAFVRSASRAEDIFARHDIRAEIVECDLEGALDGLDARLERIRPAVVFNLAGYGVRREERDEARARRVNTRFVEHLCESAARTARRDWPGRSLVHVGSALEYGMLGGNLAEDSVTNPTTLYGMTKLAGTDHVTRRSTDTQPRLRGITARLFTVYGPGETPGRLLPSLVRAAASGEPIDLTDGRQERDFTYVEDVADGLLRLGAAPTAPWPVVNLASGRLTEVRVFAREAAQQLGLTDDRLRFGALPTRTEEMRHAPVTTDRLVALTGWRPSTPIDQGIARTLAGGRRAGRG